MFFFYIQQKVAWSANQYRPDAGRAKKSKAKRLQPLSADKGLKFQGPGAGIGIQEIQEIWEISEILDILEIIEILGILEILEVLEILEILNC